VQRRGYVISTPLEISEAHQWMRAPGPGLVLSALIVDKGVSVGVLFYERYLCARQVTAGTLKIDVATSIGFLDCVSADEQPKWLPRVNRSLGHASDADGRRCLPRTGQLDQSPMAAGLRRL
jgi:hypothetical protein